MTSIAAGAPRGDAHIYDVKMGQMTQETGNRPHGEAAAILAVPFPRVDTNAHIKGDACGGFAAADISYIIVRASFAPIHHSKQPFHSTGDPSHRRSRGRDIAE